MAPPAKKNVRRDTRQLQVVFELDEDGKYIAWCPALQGCYTQGDTYEEALENIEDVIEMCLQELREEKREVDTRFPQVIGTRQIEVVA